MKYASDPYWGEKAAAVSWGLNDSAGGGDANTYTLAIKSGNTDVNIRAGSCDRYGNFIYEWDTNGYCLYYTK